MVVHHHARFRLAVMIVHRHGEPGIEPPDDLGVQRLARAADDAQHAPCLRGRRAAFRHQQAIRGGRAGEVRDAEPGDEIEGGLGGKDAVI
jgi:hypothetical protein